MDSSLVLATAILAAIGGGIDQTSTAAHSTPPEGVQVRACGPYAALRQMLDDRFGEQPASSGLADDGSLMQIFASAATDTWTVVNVQANGSACVLAVGHHWQDVQAQALGTPA